MSSCIHLSIKVAKIHVCLNVKGATNKSDN